ncbi:MAG TPA: lamin tail domain-containing protein [Anaerolineales bacterium]|nr:lamin tail domain-containing protein [Anaerolineales bacterium]
MSRSKYPHLSQLIAYLFLLLAISWSQQQKVFSAGWVINEIHADPHASLGDANGDGVISSTQDEFIELVNDTGASVNIGGWKLNDATGLRHVFAGGTVVPNGCAIVIFGGGTPNPTTFANLLVQTASSGGVSLNNTADTLTLYNLVNVSQVSVTYGSNANNDQSITLNPDISGSGYVLHTSITPPALRYSPASKNDGTALGSDCTAETAHPSPSSDLLFYAVYPDVIGTEPQGEAFAIVNVNASPADLSGYLVSDLDGETLVFPSGVSLAQNEILWVTNNPAAFASEFGFTADLEYPTNLDGAIPDLLDGDGTTGDPDLAGTKDELVLVAPNLLTKDAIQYSTDGLIGDPLTSYEWDGAPLNFYTYGVGSQEGQLLIRQFDPSTLLVADTNTPADWQSTNKNTVRGSWRMACPNLKAGGRCKISATDWAFPQSHMVSEPYLQLLTAPDNLYAGLLEHINAATSTIYIEAFSFESAELAMALAQKAANGVKVRVLLEGSPAGGIAESQKWACRHIDDGYQGWNTPNDAGFDGECWYQYSPATGRRRYSTSHAKFLLIDSNLPEGTASRKLILSTENLDTLAMPADNKADGTTGHRGFALATNANAEILHSLAVWQDDFDDMNLDGIPDGNHNDLRVFGSDPTKDTPAFGYPYLAPNKTGYTVRYPSAYLVPTSGQNVAMKIVQSPESSLATDGLLGMVGQANANSDRLYIWQLYEDTWWGDISSSPSADPNLRLESYIAAAANGAEVRIILNLLYVQIGDEYVPIPDDDATDPRDNYDTCDYVNSFAGAPYHYNIACVVGRVTLDDVHAKTVLVWDGGVGYSHVGSINGSESSSKGNRELALQVQNNLLFCYLQGVFVGDWQALSSQAVSPIQCWPNRLYLPILLR